MKSYVLYAAVAAFGVLLALPGCESAPKNSSKTEEATVPSVGRQYGETLHGAIDQAKEVRGKIESAGKALDHVGGVGK